MIRRTTSSSRKPTDRDVLLTTRGQSEVTGTVLLLAVIVILSSLVGVVILGSIDTQDNPTANLAVSINATTVTIDHHGGSRLPHNAVTAVFRDGRTERHSLQTFRERQGNGDDTFAPGETLTRVHNATDAIRVLVVDEPTNTVLVDRACDVPTDANFVGC